MGVFALSFTLCIIYELVVSDTRGKDVLPQPDFLYFDRSNEQFFFVYPEGTTHQQLQPVAAAIHKRGHKVAATRILDLRLAYTEGAAPGVLLAHKRLVDVRDADLALSSLKAIVQPKFYSIRYTCVELRLCLCGKIDAAQTRMPDFVPHFWPEDPLDFCAKYVACLQEIDGFYELIMGSAKSPEPLLWLVSAMLKSIGAMSSRIEINYSVLEEDCRHN